jgi:hypothetical protein
VVARPRNRDKGKREQKILRRGPEANPVRAAVLDGGGKTRAMNSSSNRSFANVETGSACTLMRQVLRRLGNDFQCKMIDHSETYVDGQVHTNEMEHFCSLQKRGSNGTKVASSRSTIRYVGEQAFRLTPY